MLMQKVPQDNGEDRVTPEQIARWEALRNRLADELARGFTLRRIAIDTRLEPAQIEEWAKASTAFRKPSRWCGEPPFAEQIESKVESWFTELDAERNQPGMDKPSFVETGTARDIIAGFQRARALRELVEISAPPGSGKTWAMDHYVARCRKAEGFDCPVWTITLGENKISLKVILGEIITCMEGEKSRYGGSYVTDPRETEYQLQHRINERAQGIRQGLVIIDEAQHLGLFNGIVRGNALNIVNGLRELCGDKGVFGIGLLSNGEVYLQAKKARSVQLSSRIEAWRIEAQRPDADDVEAIIAAWGVSGKSERAYCVKVGTGEGGLRSLTSVFRAARHEYGEISYRTMMAIRRV